MSRPRFSGGSRPRPHAWAFGLVLLLSCFGVAAAFGATTGKLQGRIVATDTGEPIGYADVALLPIDTTMRRVGGLTNADGTFLLEAAPGRYTLQVRALSYARKRVEGVAIEAGKLVPFSTGLTPEALLQEEVVVEAKALQNSETSMLAARRKAASMSDAVSAEQVRKSGDKDAAEVLRRVTGLSVADGKYVFVRGLGERYSSTEVDGVRIASPEQNKRVVPLDLLPASLLDHIVVQKTYTADRPGEFGGGDVQVRTKDFPGSRTLQFSVSQGVDEGTTFRRLGTYRGGASDPYGFGAGSRDIPQSVYDVAGTRKLVWSENPEIGFKKATLAAVGKSFSNVWSPSSERAIPNAGYGATYGDEFRVFGRPLGVIETWSYSRSFDQRDERQRFFQEKEDLINDDPQYDYSVTRSKEAVQLSGISGLSYRVSPRHSFHLRGLYTNSAEDEVRVYQGQDQNWTDATGDWQTFRNTRLLYVQRNVLSGSFEGQHQIPRLFGANLDWKFTRSQASRQQPDRREVTFGRNFYTDGDGNLVEYWLMGSAVREFGDLKEHGWGTTLSASVPYRLGALGNGKVVLGVDRQVKKRTNFYRRFTFYPGDGADRTRSPEEIFDPTAFEDSLSPAWVEETTLDIDNYRANQRVTAGYLSADLPLGQRLRANLGVRAEGGFQEVRSYDLFEPARITAAGRLDDTDWLPSLNLTWTVTDMANLRVGASRTLSRPDLNELSPSPALEYRGGFRVSGNPDLERALIDNYDLRFEVFPGLSEVLAVGYFFKSLHQPIEQAIKGGAPQILKPENSDRGRNTGVELEARTGLGRFWRRLVGLSLTSNASFIHSSVRLKPQTTELGSTEHPLQGQANYLVNVGLGYGSSRARLDGALLLGATGRRLHALGPKPLPDIYEEPTSSLDATLNFAPFRRARLKIAARNLLDPRIRLIQGDRQIASYRPGRGYSFALAYGGS